MLRFDSMIAMIELVASFFAYPVVMVRSIQYVPKNNIGVTRYNFVLYQAISIIFVRNVVASYQKGNSFSHRK